MATKSTDSASKGRPKKRVVVIGAGFAGLAAACKLKRLGSDALEVTVLEASQRVGGRAWTQEFEFGEVEMGATWFHGVVGHPLVELARKEGILTEGYLKAGGLSFEQLDQLNREHLTVADKHASKADTAPAGGDEDEEDPAGSWFSDFLLPDAVEPLAGEQRDLATTAFQRYADAMKELEKVDIDGKSAVGDFLRTKFQEAVTSSQLSDPALSVFASAWRSRELLQRAIDGYYTTDDVAVAHVKAYSDLPGPLLPVPGGYQALAGVMARELDIQFGFEVCEVNWRGTSHAPVKVRSVDGRELEADAVIITVSVGVLQAYHQRLFTPALPASKLAALESIRLGVVDKLFFQLIPPKQVATVQDLVLGLTGIMGAYAAHSRSSSDGDDDGRRNDSKTGVADDVVGIAAVIAAAAATAHDGGGDGDGDELAVQACAMLWPASAEMLGPQLVHPYLVGECGAFEGALRPPYQRRGGEDSDRVAGLQTESTSLTGFCLSSVSEILYGNTFKYIYPRATTPMTYPDGEPRQDFLANSWITGVGALEMEQLDEQQLLASAEQLLARFPQLPLPSGAELKVFRTKWGMDRLFHGSYSYVGVGADMGVVEVLGRPLMGRNGLPVVCFAGEATHPKYMGTTHGAYMSGEREADRLLQAWKVAKKTTR